MLTLAACGGRPGSVISESVSTTDAVVTSTSLSPSSTTTESVESIPTLGSGEEDLEPGTYLLDFQTRAAATRNYPQVLLTVPEGWQNYDGWLVGAGRDSERNSSHTRFVSFWDVDEVYAHPCDWAGEMIDPGRTVDGLVTALVDRPMRNATTPVEVTIDGYQGYMLECPFPPISTSPPATKASSKAGPGRAGAPTGISRARVRPIGCGFLTWMAPGS